MDHFRLLLLTLQLLLLPFLLSGSRSNHRHFAEFLQELPKQSSGPQFDTSVPANVTGLVGKSARLRCRVKNLGNLTVSWVRHRDIHLLTVGRYTYTSDQRFEAVHSPHTEDWTLHIRYAQKKDSGIYECQVSTTPPIGHPVHLTIVEPLTEIVGEPDLFINTGSTINLTCLVSFAPEPTTGVLWRHNGQVINFDSPRGGVSLVTEKGAVTNSRLLIQKAAAQDTGLYTCAPSNVPPDSVRVHVLQGDLPAAMQRGCASGSAEKWLRVTLVWLLPLVNLLPAASTISIPWVSGSRRHTSGTHGSPHR